MAKFHNGYEDIKVRLVAFKGNESIILISMQNLMKVILETIHLIILKLRELSKKLSQEKLFLNMLLKDKMLLFKLRIFLVSV